MSKGSLTASPTKNVGTIPGSLGAMNDAEESCLEAPLSALPCIDPYCDPETLHPFLVEEANDSLSNPCTAAVKEDAMLPPNQGLLQRIMLGNYSQSRAPTDLRSLNTSETPFQPPWKATPCLSCALQEGRSTYFHTEPSKSCNVLASTDLRYVQLATTECGSAQTWSPRKRCSKWRFASLTG